MFNLLNTNRGEIIGEPKKKIIRSARTHADSREGERPSTFQTIWAAGGLERGSGLVTSELTFSAILYTVQVPFLVHTLPRNPSALHKTYSHLLGFIYQNVLKRNISPSQYTIINSKRVIGLNISLVL